MHREKLAKMHFTGTGKKGKHLELDEWSANEHSRLQKEHLAGMQTYRSSAKQLLAPYCRCFSWVANHQLGSYV